MLRLRTRMQSMETQYFARIETETLESEKSARIAYTYAKYENIQKLKIFQVQVVSAKMRLFVLCIRVRTARSFFKISIFRRKM